MTAPDMPCSAGRSKRTHLLGFDPLFELSSLTRTNGFQLSGETDNDRSGSPVASAGVLNGDGSTT